MEISAARLSPEQVNHYKSQGYVLFREPVFAPEKFARLQGIFEADLAQYGEAGLDTIHFRDERLLEFLLCDDVLDLVEPLVGPDIGLWSSHFISKPAGVGKATPWHEDSSYWNGRITTMEGICTLWLALDKVDRANGAMTVIPGTHSNGFSTYQPVSSEENIFNSEIRPEQLDLARAVTFELEPNQCSLHEARIIHGADPNTSTRRRAGYTMRYFPLTSRVLPERNVGHKLWLARGRDRVGNTFEN